MGVPPISSVIPGTQKFPQWEYDVLQQLGAKATEANLVVLNAIAKAEGMPESANNWLAIEASTPGEWGPQGSEKAISNYGKPGNAVSSGEWNSSGVATYASYATGVQALADFLQHGHPKIVAALQNPSSTVATVAQAFIQDGAWAGDDASIAKAASIPAAEYEPWVSSSNGSSGSSSTSSGITFSHCDSRAAIIQLPGLFGNVTVLNACQAKAIVGGVLVGVGAIIIAGGIVLIGSNTALNLELNPLAKAIGNAIGQAQSRILGPSKAETEKKESPRQRENRVWREMFDEGKITKEQYEAGES